MVILFGGITYIDAVEPLIIICIAALAIAFGVAINSILMTLERTRIVSLLSMVSVGLSFLLSYIALVPLNLGMVGTAWARTFAAVAALGLNLYVLSRFIKISIDKEALWKASLACVVLVVAVLGLDFGRMQFSSEPYQFLVLDLGILPIYVIVAGLTYFLALIGLRAIKTEDIRLIKEYLPRRLSRVAHWLERIAAPD
jgi:Na+-driven multidrug efflux pump